MTLLIEARCHSCWTQNKHDEESTFNQLLASTPSQSEPLPCSYPPFRFYFCRNSGIVSLQGCLLKQHLREIRDLANYSVRSHQVPRMRDRDNPPAKTAGSDSAKRSTICIFSQLRRGGDKRRSSRQMSSCQRQLALPAWRSSGLQGSAGRSRSPVVCSGLADMKFYVPTITRYAHGLLAVREVFSSEQSPSQLRSAINPG